MGIYIEEVFYTYANLEAKGNQFLLPVSTEKEMIYLQKTKHLPEYDRKHALQERRTPLLDFPY
jgi:hypothetical protein